MAIDISIVVTPANKNTELYQKLVPWHPLSIRSYVGQHDATSSLKELFPNDRVRFLVKKDNCFYTTKLDDRGEWTVSLPDLIISWGLKDAVYDLLYDFLYDVVYNDKPTIDTLNFYQPVIRQLHVPETKPLEEPVPTCYELKMYHDTMRDWMFFQVNRASKEAPFTTIVKDYSKVGKRPFFGQMFLSNDWGLLKSDLDFLGDLYQAEYGEPICIQTLLNEHAEALVPRPGVLPNTFPMMFRNSIENLMKINDCENNLIES